MKSNQVMTRIKTIAGASEIEEFPVKILLHSNTTQNVVYLDIDNIHWSNIDGEYTIVIEVGVQ